MSKSIPMDPYAGFANRYDLSFGPFGDLDPQLAEFFRLVFTRHAVQTVLDCACGTGRHLPLLHSLGCQVIGSDISESMLQQAAQNLSQLGMQLPLHQADFRQLPALFPQPFDALVCLGAIGFLPGEGEFRKAFASMFQVLRPGGLLVLTAMPTDRQWREKPRFLLNSSRPGFDRIFVIDYYEDRACYHILDLFHNQAASELKTWSAELYPLLRDDQERLLRSVGFSKVDFYASFDFSPYDRWTSNSLITVAQR